MPDAAHYEANPWERLSATRVSLFRRCPRWYHHKYRQWHQEPRAAVMRAGTAVQRAFERLVKSPANPGEAHDIHARALARMSDLVRYELKVARGEHLEDPGAVGEWDINPHRAQTWGKRALDTHWRHVAAFIEYHPEFGEATHEEAWFSARPQLWPDGPDGGDVIPDGWFSFKPDAVYTEPDGSRVLVDLKIGSGREPFAEENREQLRMYAWAEEQCGRRFDRLELWFLGREDPVEVVEPFNDYERRMVDQLSPESLDAVGTDPTPSETWCARCPFAEVCDASAVDRTAVPVGLCSPWDDVDNGCDLTEIPARVIGIGEPKEKRGLMTRRVTLANSSGVRTYTWAAYDIQDLGIRAGHAYTFRGLRTWKCRHRGVQLDIGAETAAVPLEMETTT